MRTRVINIKTPSNLLRNTIYQVPQSGTFIFIKHHPKQNIIRSKLKLDTFKFKICQENPR